MTVELFTLRIGGGKSFYARMDNGKKMTVVDAFEVLNSGPLPVVVGMCSVDVRLQFDREEAGTKQIRVSFKDEDGKLAMPSLETIIEVKTPDHAPTVTVPFALLIKLLSLPAFGEFSIDLAVDGRTEAITHLYVRQKVIGRL